VLRASLCCVEGMAWPLADVGTFLACLTQHNVAGVNAILKVAFFHRLGIASISSPHPHPPFVILSNPLSSRACRGISVCDQGVRSLRQALGRLFDRLRMTQRDLVSGLGLRSFDRLRMTQRDLRLWAGTEIPPIRYAQGRLSIGMTEHPPSSHKLAFAISTIKSKLALPVRSHRDRPLV
jgi:hypothetical protein